MARLQLNKNQFMGYLLVFKRFQTEWSYSYPQKLVKILALMVVAHIAHIALK